MKLSHRQLYIVVIAVIAFLTALDAGVFGGAFGVVSQTIKDAAIIVNMGLGVTCSVLPAWNDPNAPLPKLPTPPNVK